MTTRFKEEDLTEGLTGAIHETGHALYEQVMLRVAGLLVPLDRRSGQGLQVLLPAELHRWTSWTAGFAIHCVR
jgi:hypothetical protein